MNWTEPQTLRGFFLFCFSPNHQENKKMKTILSVVTLLAATTTLANASSATLTESNNLIYFWDFSKDGNPTKGTVDGGSFTYNADGYGTLSSKGNDWWEEGQGPYVKTSVSGIYANSFTVSFDVANCRLKNLYRHESLLAVYTDKGVSLDHMLRVSNGTPSAATNWGAGNIELRIGGNDESGTSYFGGATSSAVAEICDYSKVSGTDWTRITFSSDGQNFKIYVDGEKTQEVAFVTQAVAITGFEIGSALTNGNYSVTGVSYDNIAFWNVVLSEDQVKNLSFSVAPEPSAFGFLAGLEVLSLAVACRRRSC